MDVARRGDLALAFDRRTFGCGNQLAIGWPASLTRTLARPTPVLQGPPICDALVRPLRQRPLGLRDSSGHAVARRSRMRLRRRRRGLRRLQSHRRGTTRDAGRIPADSLQRLGVDSLDVAFVHDISPDFAYFPNGGEEQYEIARKGALRRGTYGESLCQAICRRGYRRMTDHLAPQNRLGQLWVKRSSVRPGFEPQLTRFSLVVVLVSFVFGRHKPTQYQSITPFILCRPGPRLKNAAELPIG